MTVSLGGNTYLAQECPHLYVPFKALRLRRAAVVWLNERHWCSTGIDPTNVEVADELKGRLLASFGVSVPSDVDAADAHLETQVMLHADRYGGTFGHSHGGSGRAGTIGSFSAKGIGPTPLRDPDANWFHSHGCMWLEEAIREAIFAEACWHSFPWQANPIVAIIDTGEHLVHPDGGIGARRAIAIRPAALRVSHLERNILFGTAGTPESDQFQDFCRVAEVIAYIRENGIDPPHAVVRDILASIMTRLCEQSGFVRAYRLFHGDFLSSNQCVTGALIDLGAFRGVTDWRRRAWETNGLPFGGEDRRLFQTGRSLAFHLRKHGGDSDQDRLIPLDRLGAMITAQFEAALRTLCGGHPEAATIAARLTEFFEREQCTPLSDAAAWPRLIAGIRGRSSADEGDYGYRIGREIADDLNKGARPLTRSARTALLRWAAPFEHATREAVLSRTGALLDSMGAAPCPSRLNDFIARHVNALRRRFTPLSDTEAIIRVYTSFGLLILDCYDIAIMRRYWRIEGASVNERLLVQGATVAPWSGCRTYEAGAGQMGLICSSDPQADLRRLRRS